MRNTEIIKRIWPTLTINTPRFPGLLKEHCSAWRHLGMCSDPQTTPLEYMLLQDKDFEHLLNTTQHNELIPAFTEIFKSPDTKEWSPDAWLGLLKHYLISIPDNRHLSIQRLHKLWLRFSPLWKKPCGTNTDIELQCALTSTFPHKHALNRLLRHLTEPLSSQVRAVIEANISHWATLCAEAAWEKHNTNGSLHGTRSKETYAALLMKSWLRGVPNF